METLTAARIIGFSCVFALALPLAARAGASASAGGGALPVPPPMPRRQIAPPAEGFPGETVELEDSGAKFTLFLPNGWNSTPKSRIALTAHFHAAVWFGIQEHLRRGLTGPLVCFYLGEGSSVYQKPFLDRQQFGRIVRIIEKELEKRGAPRGVLVTTVDISSFSAGYGAVRELLQTPSVFKMIRRIVLSDSMYAGFGPAAKEGVRPDPQEDQIQVFVPFAREAVEGKKTFVFTHSEVPTPSYSNSAECAAALVRALGLKSKRVRPGSTPAASDPEYPLRSRCDAGCLHIWGYAGEDAQAHMTHPRHLAGVWLALDRAGCP